MVLWIFHSVWDFRIISLSPDFHFHTICMSRLSHLETWLLKLWQSQVNYWLLWTVMLLIWIENDTNKPIMWPRSTELGIHLSGGIDDVHQIRTNKQTIIPSPCESQFWKLNFSYKMELFQSSKCQSFRSKTPAHLGSWSCSRKIPFSSKIPFQLGYNTRTVSRTYQPDSRDMWVCYVLYSMPIIEPQHTTTHPATTHIPLPAKTFQREPHGLARSRRTA